MKLTQIFYSILIILISCSFSLRAVETPGVSPEVQERFKKLATERLAVITSNPQHTQKDIDQALDAAQEEVQSEIQMQEALRYLKKIGIGLAGYWLLNKASNKIVGNIPRDKIVVFINAQEATKYILMGIGTAGFQAYFQGKLTKDICKNSTKDTLKYVFVEKLKTFTERSYFAYLSAFDFLPTDFAWNNINSDNNWIVKNLKRLITAGYYLSL